MTTFYIGPDGNDASSGTSRANRIKTRSRLEALINDPSFTPPFEVCFEGNFDRDWAPPGWFELFRFDQARAAGIHLRATAVAMADAAIPLPIFCDYHRFITPAQAVQVGSTPIWEIANILPAGNRVRRAFGCDYKSGSVSAEGLKFFEVWESGGASLAQCYANLGTHPDFNWTQYDTAGNLGTSLFIYSPVNPIALYGGITVVSDLSYALMVMQQDGWTVDPDLVFQGGGYAAVILKSCANARFEGQVRGWHFYTSGLLVIDDGTAKSTQNLTLAPLMDTAVRSLPFYSTDSAHQMGGHHGIVISDTADVNGMTVLAKASNGRPTRIADCLHGGIGNAPPLAGKMHRNIVVEREVAFDFRNVIYGRAYALVGLDTQVENVQVGGIITNQPTSSQLGGKSIRCIGGTCSAGKPDGGLIALRFGGTTNKADTAQGFSFYTSAQSDVNDVAVIDWTFDGCMSGGIAFNQGAATQTYRGSVAVAGCTFIAPCQPGASHFPPDAFPPANGAIYAVSHNLFNVQPEQVISYYGNTAIGYTQGRRFVSGVANGVFPLDSPSFMPTGRNAGWKLLPQRPQ